jgi:hypothetical protein
MEPINKLLEEFEELKKKITPDHVKKAFKYLDKKNHEAVVFLFEALIGVMRG